jgi:hypothetical protein
VRALLRILLRVFHLKDNLHGVDENIDLVAVVEEDLLEDSFHWSDILLQYYYSDYCLNEVHCTEEIEVHCTEDTEVHCTEEIEVRCTEEVERYNPYHQEVEEHPYYQEEVEEHPYYQEEVEERQY